MRLLKSHEFRRVKKEGKRSCGKYLVLHISFRDPEETNRPKLGITVTKKFGRAHERNRFKRMVREAFRTQQHKLAANCIVHVFPGHAFFEATLVDLQQELLVLMGVL